MAGEVASAYVSLLPSAANFQANFERETNGPMRGAAKNLGKILTAGLAAAGVAAGAALVEGISQDKDSDRMAAALGLSPAESERLGGVAGTLFKNAYGASFGEVSGAVESVVSSISGMRTASTADIQAVTAKALDFAAVFETEVGRSAQVAGQLITSGLADNAVQAFDLITAASQRVPEAIREDVLDAADEYGGFARQIGLDGEQLFALLVEGAEQGTFGIDKTGDAIAEFAKLVTGDLARTEPIIEGLGLNYGDMANALVAGGDQAAGATKQIVDGLLGIEDPAAQTRAALELFGTPLEDLGTNNIPEFLTALSGGSDAMADFEGAADRMGEAVNDNAATNLESFKRQITQTFVETMNDNVLPKVNAFASFLSTGLGPAMSVAGDIAGETGIVLQNFAGWVAANEQPIRVVAGIIAAVFLPYVIAMGVQATISAIKSAAAWALSAASSVAAAAILSVSYAIAVAGWVLMGAQALLGAAKVAAAWLIALGPIALVIAAIVGLVALIIWKFDDIKKVVAFAWEWVKTKTAALWGSIVGVISSAVGRVFGVLRGIQSIINVVIGFFGRIKDGIVTKWNELLSFVGGIPGHLASMGAGMWDWIGDTFRSALNAVIRMWNNFSLTIDIPDAIPGLPDKWTINTPNIPLLADGGFVTRPTLAVVGEAGPEAVVPLPRLGEFANRHAGGMGSSGTLDFDYDRLADALSRRPGYFSISDREAAKLQLMQNRAMADLR